MKESERIILISPADQPQPDWAKKIQQIKFAESSPRDQIWCPMGQKPSLDKHFVTIKKYADKPGQTQKGCGLCFIYHKKYVGYIPILNIKCAIYCNSVSLFLRWKHCGLLSSIKSQTNLQEFGYQEFSI